MEVGGSRHPCLFSSHKVLKRTQRGAYWQPQPIRHRASGGVMVKRELLVPAIRVHGLHPLPNSLASQLPKLVLHADRRESLSAWDGYLGAGLGWRFKMV